MKRILFALAFLAFASTVQAQQLAHIEIKAGTIPGTSYNVIVDTAPSVNVPAMPLDPSCACVKAGQITIAAGDTSPHTWKVTAQVVDPVFGTVLSAPISVTVSAPPQPSIPTVTVKPGP